MTDLPNWEVDAPLDFGWTQKAFELLKLGKLTVSVTQHGAAQRLSVSGACPRCTHDVGFSIQTKVLLPAGGGVGTLATATGTPDDDYDVQCRCTDAHPGRPEAQAAGCGIYFTVAVSGVS